MAAEATVDSDHVTTTVESRRLRHFRARVVTFIAAGLNVVGRQHRSLEKFLLVPAVLLLPFLALLFAVGHVARILDVWRSMAYTR